MEIIKQWIIKNSHYVQTSDGKYYKWIETNMYGFSEISANEMIELLTK